MSAIKQEETKKHYSPQEYLAILEASETRVEYLNGEVRFMAGGTFNHSRLASRFQTQLTNSLANKGKGCEVFNSDFQVSIEKHNSYVLPDISVVCGEIEVSDKDQNSAINPILVVEVTSETTKDYDLGRKFFLYRSIKSLKEYVIVSQTEPLVMVHTKKQGIDIWQFKNFESLDDIIYLESIDVNISMKDLYSNIKFENNNQKQ